MNKKNGTIAWPKGHASERIPYGAPWIDTYLVALEGGIADASARITGNGGNITVEEWGPGGDTTESDVELIVN